MSESLEVVVARKAQAMLALMAPNRPVKQLYIDTKYDLFFINTFLFCKQYFFKSSHIYLLIYQTHSHTCIHVTVYIQVKSSHSSYTKTETQFSCNNHTNGAESPGF